MWTLLSSVETFTYSRDFTHYEDVYLVWRLLSSFATFFRYGDLYPVWKLLSSMEIFIQCEDFYVVWRLLFSMETFVQYRELYLVWRLLPTIIFIIFWDFLMFYQIFLSPHVKQCAIIAYKHGIYEMPHELPNNVRLTILEIRKNQETC